VVVPADAAVLDALAFGGEFGGKFLGSVDAVVGAVVADLDADASSLAFKTELSLNSFGPGEAHLVDDGEFAAGRIAKNGATTKLLSGEIVPSCRELAPKKRGLVLIGEDEVPGLELVHLEDARGVSGDGGASAWGTCLFAKLAGGALGSLHCGGSHLDAQGTKPLSVLPTKMAPLCVPREEALLEGSQVGLGRFRDAVEGQRLSGGKHIVKAADNREGGLPVVGDGDFVTICQGKVRPVPFKDIPATMVFAKEHLWTE
jgi:hypothetical protein